MALPEVLSGSAFLVLGVSADASGTVMMRWSILWR